MLNDNTKIGLISYVHSKKRRFFDISLGKRLHNTA